MKTTSRHFIPAAAAIALVLCAPQAFAEGGCIGAPMTKLAPAMNAAIYLMFGVLAIILPAFLFFIFHLARRAKLPPPPHEELGHCTTTEPS